jgi:hypothetical protein
LGKEIRKLGNYPSSWMRKKKNGFPTRNRNIQTRIVLEKWERGGS